MFCANASYKLASCTLHSIALLCQHTPSPFGRPSPSQTPHVYAESHWKYHTFERYYTCSCSELKQNAQQKVGKCSLAFPLQNGIVTLFENFTYKHARFDKLRGGGIHPLVSRVS